MVNFEYRMNSRSDNKGYKIRLLVRDIPPLPDGQGNNIILFYTNGEKRFAFAVTESAFDEFATTIAYTQKLLKDERDKNDQDAEV